MDRHDAGVASAMVNTSQQVGGSIGTSLLSTLFASSAASYLSSHHHGSGASAAAVVHGYTTAFWWSAGIFALGLVIALTVFPARLRPVSAAHDAAPADASLATG